MAVNWTATAPYESVVETGAVGVVLRGLTLRHYSKSVANNYAVHLTVRGDQTLPAAVGQTPVLPLTITLQPYRLWLGDKVPGVQAGLVREREERLRERERKEREKRKREREMNAVATSCCYSSR